MDNKVLEALKNAMQKRFEERQSEPNQYVVGYFRTDNEELYGYHLSSSCQVTQDILSAKRYSGDNPYKQLEVISKNLRHVLETTEAFPGFLGLGYQVKQEYFEGVSPDDLYLEAIYLEEGTPKQSFRFQLINP